MRTGLALAVTFCLALLALIGLLVVLHVRGSAALKSEPATTAATTAASVSSGTKTAEDGTRQGSADARADLARGVLGWIELGGWGYPRPEPFEKVSTADILGRDFGVRVTRTNRGGCVLPPDAHYQRAHGDAYNKVMRAAIIAKHGADVFEVAATRASKENDRLSEQFERRQEEREKEADAERKSGVRCDPPFYVDRSGVRRVKPECMYESKWMPASP